LATPTAYSAALKPGLIFRGRKFSRSEPARLEAGPILINSGYRNSRVNSLVGGIRNLQHPFAPPRRFVRIGYYK
jgi:hypothetical protein